MSFLGIGKKFNNNVYGLDKKTDWQGENGLKKALKEDPLFSKKDIRHIKKAITNGTLEAEMNKMGTEMREAFGLKLQNIDHNKDMSRITTETLKEIEQKGALGAADCLDALDGLAANEIPGKGMGTISNPNEASTFLGALGQALGTDSETQARIGKNMLKGLDLLTA